MIRQELEAMQHTGFHSDIFSGRFPSGKQFLAKEYGKKANGFSREHAQEIAAYIRRFVTTAGQIGIPVVEPFGHFIERNGHPGKVNLVEAVPAAGVDLRTRFKDEGVSNREVLRDIGRYLDMHKVVWQNGFPISLDPPPANFCLDPDGKLTYIDNMPPRQRLDNGSYISEWPIPPEESTSFIEQRYFSPKQAQVIYPQLLRAVEGRGIPFDAIKFAIGAKLGLDAFRMIDFNDSVRDDLLRHPTPQDVDKLRIIAAEHRSGEQIDASTFADIYHLTHIGIGGILPSQEDIDQAAALLR